MSAIIAVSPFMWRLTYFTGHTDCKALMISWPFYIKVGTFPSGKCLLMAWWIDNRVASGQNAAVYGCHWLTELYACTTWSFLISCKWDQIYNRTLTRACSFRRKISCLLKTTLWSVMPGRFLFPTQHFCRRYTVRIFCRFLSLFSVPI